MSVCDVTHRFKTLELKISNDMYVTEKKYNAGYSKLFSNKKLTISRDLLIGMCFEIHCSKKKGGKRRKNPN